MLKRTRNCYALVHNDYIQADTIHFSDDLSVSCVIAAPSIIKYTRSSTLTSCPLLSDHWKILRLKRLENCPNGRAA